MVRDRLHNHQFPGSDYSYNSSASDSFHTQEWTLSTIHNQAMGVNEDISATHEEPLFLPPSPITWTGEEVSTNRCIGSSFHSDSSDYEIISRSHPSHRNFTRNFFSNTRHPDSVGDYEQIEVSNNEIEKSKCGLCKKLLSEKSPWSSSRVFPGGDMPIAGVLSCCHVYHAECLEHATPLANKIDPPCPLCTKNSYS